ncbi:MAG: hypothetical protein Fur0032_02370 [Terrimicrobiaceae bacterium]
MTAEIFQDWEANAGNLKSQLVLASLRLAQICHRLPSDRRWLGWPVLALHTILVEWLLGIELSYKATVGKGLRLYHGTGLVVHEKVVIGAGCTLRHGTTIGNRRSHDDVPVLGDRVDVGCHAVLIGKIKIGDGACIGAGSVVLNDVAAGQTVAGNPAR